MSAGSGPDRGMRTLPTLWYPRCPSCDQRATDRASLGDETGPQDPPDQQIQCQHCGREGHVDDHSHWEAEPLDA